MKPRDALLSLCHANLVRILEISPDGDMHMECMQTSLQRHILAGQRCSAPAKLKIARQVSSGLRHLHMLDMQHEDLCPNNILLAWRHGELHVKLCDFYNECTGCKRTAAYAAPEVVLSPAADVTAAADVWAFACCLLFMEGAEPFRGFEDNLAVFFYVATHSAVSCSKSITFELREPSRRSYSRITPGASGTRRRTSSPRSTCRSAPWSMPRASAGSSPIARCWPTGWCARRSRRATVIRTASTSSMP
jgi:serine/threonine protein kinase